MHKTVKYKGVYKVGRQNRKGGYRVCITLPEVGQVFFGNYRDAEVGGQVADIAHLIFKPNSSSEVLNNPPETYETSKVLDYFRTWKLKKYIDIVQSKTSRYNKQIESFLDGLKENIDILDYTPYMKKDISEYKGICRGSDKSYKARMSFNGSLHSIYLGSYVEPWQAAIAYDIFALLFKDYTENRLNYPDRKEEVLKFIPILHLSDLIDRVSKEIKCKPRFSMSLGKGNMLVNPEEHYIGVYDFPKGDSKYRTMICIKGKVVWVGCYDLKKDAAIVYDTMAHLFKDNIYKVNFETSVTPQSLMSNIEKYNLYGAINRAEKLSGVKANLSPENKQGIKLDKSGRFETHPPVKEEVSETASPETPKDSISVPSDSEDFPNEPLKFTVSKRERPIFPETVQVISGEDEGTSTSHLSPLDTLMEEQSGCPIILDEADANTLIRTWNPHRMLRDYERAGFIKPFAIGDKDIQVNFRYFKKSEILTLQKFKDIDLNFLWEHEVKQILNSPEYPLDFYKLHDLIKPINTFHGEDVYTKKSLDRLTSDVKGFENIETLYKLCTLFRSRWDSLAYRTEILSQMASNMGLFKSENSSLQEIALTNEIYDKFFNGDGSAKAILVEISILRRAFNLAIDSPDDAVWNLVDTLKAKGVITLVAKVPVDVFYINLEVLKYHDNIAWDKLKHY